MSAPTAPPQPLSAAPVAPAVSAHAAVESAARALARAGVGQPWSTTGPALEVQSAPRGPGAALAHLMNLVALVLSVAVIGWWPGIGLALAWAVLWSAWVDLGGGRGWIRRLAPSRLSYTLIAWPAPLPQRTRRRIRLLIAAPLALDPADPGPAARLALELARRHRAAGESEVDLVFAWLTGGADGLEVLLHNHRKPLAGDGLLKVLCLVGGAPAIVTHEGRLRPAQPSAHLCGPARRLGLPEIRRQTLASRALWAHVDAATVRANPEAIETIWGLIQALRAEAEEGGWS